MSIGTVIAVVMVVGAALIAFGVLPTPSLTVTAVMAIVALAAAVAGKL